MTIGKYPIIYADPPWRYAQKGLQGAAEHHYPTMSINELCALPVAELAAPDSALFMWYKLPRLTRRGVIERMIQKYYFFPLRPTCFA